MACTLLGRNNPLTNIPKGFSSEMTLEVAEGRLQVPGLCMPKTDAICLIKCFFAEKLMQFNKSIYCFHWFSCYFIIILFYSYLITYLIMLFYCLKD